MLGKVTFQSDYPNNKNNKIKSKAYMSFIRFINCLLKCDSVLLKMYDL